MAEAKKKKSLGKGLDALFSDTSGSIVADINSSGEKESISVLAISDIEPNKNQPRRDFDKEKLAALSDSIKEHGVVSPILVTPTKNGTYRIYGANGDFLCLSRSENGTLTSLKNFFGA